MRQSRRRVFQALAATAGVTAAAATAQEAADLAPLRHVADAHGVTLSDERLRVLQPVLERRKTSLQALRDFAIDESVPPTH